MNIQIKKFFYGDIPEDKTGSNNIDSSQIPPLGGGGAVGASWPLWEVFIRSKQGLDHKHAGSLHAADAQMAIENARDVYTRRMEGVSIWVVESKYIHASVPEESGELYEPAEDKIYRHPTFYDLPDEVKHM
jgi:ring-1,2-phenylacetyl-CoA epoxidase subunit PaaB